MTTTRPRHLDIRVARPHTGYMSPRMFWILFLAIPVMFWGMVVSLASDASAHGTMDNVTSCQTTKRGAAHVTTIVRDGHTSTRRNLSVAAFPAVGKRSVVHVPKQRQQRRVVRCRVMGNVVRIATQGRAVVLIHQPKPAVVPPPAAPVEVAPTSPAPAALATWRQPVLMHSTVTADWGVEQAVAAWNSALPEGRKITLTSVPCDVTTPACVTVSEVPYVPEGPTWWGAAYMAYGFDQRDMTGCSVSLASHVPAWGRPSVTSHEIGHCIGLPHWDDFEGSVMNTLTYHEKGLPTTWDLAWVSSAYVAAP